MSLRSRHLIRYGFALLGAAALAGCSSKGDGGTEPGGAIALALSAAGASIVQGGSTPVTGTLTRSGGFTGAVNLTVTGAPAGVTAVVSNVVTTGLVTTATITVTVDAAAAVGGPTTLTVHGTGSGVSEATATFALTITATPAYTLALSQSALTIVQGAATPTTTVTLARTNFPANVALSVDNLPTGVTASFNPASPVSGNTSVLTLTVAANAPTGTFTNLAVRGVAAPLADRTAPLSLTISALPSSFSLSLTNAALTIPQGSSAPTTTVTITRVNFTGDVALSVLNLPTGVSASFAPVNPQSGNSAVLTLSVVAGAPTGTFTNLSVQGVGTTGTVATPLTLTISAGTPAGNFSLTTTPPTSVSLTQGTNANVTVNLVRTGGNVSDVALSFTGTLPTGMTLVFLPTSTTGNSSALTITTTGATPVGTTPIVIRGNTAGLSEQTVNLTINVTAPVGPANATVSFASCTAANKAVWLAYQDGGAGPWTRVTGAADVYQFTITQSKGGIAYVVLGTGTSAVTVLYFSQAELTAGVLNFCAAAASGKTVNGTAANIANNFSGANVSFGGVTKFVGNGPFQLTDVRDGPNDVVGYSMDAFHVAPDRIFISRGLNPGNGGSVGTVDFTGAGSFAPQSTNGTMTGQTGGENQIHSLSYQTGTGANACVGSLLYSAAALGTPFTLKGVPAANQLATDFHRLSVFASTATTSRGFLEDFHDLTTRLATPFALPGLLPAVTPTNLGGPYKRLQAAATFAAELNSSASFLYSDQTVPGSSVLLSATAGWLGGLAVTLAMPDFSATVGGGFLNSWAPGSGDTVAWTLTGSGSTLPACTEGHKVSIASRSGTA
jgi:hypothetical protein